MEQPKSTATASPEIPEIKLIGVKKKEERKKGGMGLFGGNAAKGGFTGAAGGVGGGGGSFVANLIAQIGQNLGVFGLVGAIGMAAAGYGRLRAPEYKAFKAAKQEGFAAHKKVEYKGDLSRIPTTRPAGGDSLGMIAGSLDGKTPEQRAKEAAEAEAKAKADAEAKAKEEADAKAKEEAAAKAQAPDPAALMAGMGAGAPPPAAGPERKGMGHGKIGGLSTSLGGGGGLAGGAGMSGGVGGAFSNNKFDANKLLAMRSPAQASRTAAKATPSYRGVGKGKALRQLDKTARYSNLARNGANESRSTNASAPFDNTTPGGERITGAGARDGTSPADDAPSANPTPNTPGGGGGNPLDGDDGLKDCGNGVRATTCPETQQGHSVDPTDGIVSILKTLMMAVAALAVIQLVLNMTKDEPFMEWEYAEWLTFGNLIGGLGIAIAALGVTLMTMGRPIMGGIATAIGALTAVLAWTGDAGAEPTFMSMAEMAIAPVVGTFLKNPDHKTWDPNKDGGKGGYEEGGGGWF